MIQAIRLTKRFGKLTALDELSIRVLEDIRKLIYSNLLKFLGRHQ